MSRLFIEKGKILRKIGSRIGIEKVNFLSRIESNFFNFLFFFGEKVVGGTLWNILTPHKVALDAVVFEFAAEEEREREHTERESLPPFKARARKWDYNDAEWVYASY